VSARPRSAEHNARVATISGTSLRARSSRTARAAARSARPWTSPRDAACSASRCSGHPVQGRPKSGKPSPPPPPRFTGACGVSAP